jgi:uncharacterized protein
MLDVIEKLLVLQDRDRKISCVKAELASVDPQRARLQANLNGAQASLEAAKQKLRQLETDRKRLELDVDSKKQQIERYSLQQFQTKKNDEYRALATEIDNCKKDIVGFEDQQLEIMEQAEAAQKEMNAATYTANTFKKDIDAQMADLAEREQALRKQLADLEANYEQLEAAIGDESVLARYQRLRKQRGDRSVVGIEHSVCGGCHMKLPTQIVVSCQGAQEVITCPNCGRILYYTPHMDLAIID